MDEFVDVPCKIDFKAFVVEKGRVLSQLVQNKVDEIWDREFQIRQGKLTNGYIYGVVSVSENEILIEKVEYKIVLAQIRDPSLASAIDFHFLSTSGMTLSDGKVLLGQRSAYVSTYANAYEMVPSGTIDSQEGLVVDLRDQLFKELEEEAGITRGFIQQTEGWTMVYDVTTKTYEVIARIIVEPYFSSNPLQKTEGEYRSLMWLGKEEFENHLIQHSTHYVPLTKYLFTKWDRFMQAAK